MEETIYTFASAIMSASERFGLPMTKQQAFDRATDMLVRICGQKSSQAEQKPDWTLMVDWGSSVPTGPKPP